MRRVTFKSVLWGVALRLGLDPKTNLQETDAAALTEYINDRVRQGWEFFPWPELVLCEERRYRADYSNVTAYAVGAEVWYAASAAYYVAILPSTGNLPTNATYWKKQTAMRRYVALEQTGRVAIGEVIGVYDRDPMANVFVLPVPYTLGNEGVVLKPDAPDSVWVEYRLRPSEFASASWGAATAYVAGDRVYLPSTGECYLATASSTNKNPATNATEWAVMELPYVLGNYVKLAAYADALREDGQADKAAVEEGRAQARLEDEVEKIVGQQGIPPRFSVALPGR